MIERTDLSVISRGSFLPPTTSARSLRLFGGVSLSDASGQVTGRAMQRRRLAVLAVLAVARGRPVTRDKLLALLWPESDAERARHLLADTVYVLRSTLGEDVLIARGEDLALDVDRIDVDVGDFARALETGDLLRATSVYAGPFLDGFHVSDAAEFERWVDATRQQLASEYHRALERLAKDASARGDHVDAVVQWRKLSADDRLNSRAALGLMRALADSGDTAGAIRFAAVHEEIVRAELDAPADPSVTAYAAELRSASARPAPPARSVQASAASDGRAGEERTDVPPLALGTTRPAARSRWRLGTITLAVLTLGAIGVGAARLFVRQPDAGAVRVLRDTAAVQATPAIAVLPFSVGDTTLVPLADGLTDEITYALTKLRGLRVVSRSSAAAIVRRMLPATAVGDSFRVRYVVEGSVRSQGNRMRIITQLIDTRDGTQVWANEYPRQRGVDTLFAVEDEIARSIASALKLTLSSSSSSLASRQPASIEAYDRYRRGRYFWNRRNLDGAERSIGYFTQAIALDTTYAAAYAGLADAYMVLGIGNAGDVRAHEVFPKALAAAEKALALDSTLAETRAARGYVDVLYKLDWDAGARELAHALQVSPSDATTHVYRTVLLEWTGRFDDAVTEARRALETDFSVVGHVELGRALFFARQYDAAAAQLKLAIELDSTYFRAHLHLGQVYEQQGRSEDAIRELTISRSLSTRSSRPIALLSHAYASAGNRAEAMHLLATLRERAKRDYVPALDFAIVHTGLHDNDQAFVWLDSAVADRSIRPYLQDPTFDSIRSDARYGTLMRSLHLPWRGLLDNSGT